MLKQAKFVILWFFFLGLVSNSCLAVRLSGKVFDQRSNIIPFATILVKGTPYGTTTNSNGQYTLDLAPGKYTIVCQHIGFAREEREMVLEAEPVQLNFVLGDQVLTLSEVKIKAGAEDPAYEIIRQAIKKRRYYQNLVDSFQCEVYIKGKIRLRSYPKTFFGQVIDFEDGDTSKNKMIFLSETLARYSYHKPDKEKVEVLSTRVSGQTNGFGFSSPEMISFYSNNVSFGRGLNPRGFISPIADGALNFYRYKYLGAFTEDGRLINRIQVIPKRTYEPLFYGDIYIVEDDWRIHSINLSLTKKSQMELLDSLRIEQIYVPITPDIWMIRSQTVYPSVKFFGFDGYGYFVSVYSSYNLEPGFQKKYFGATILKFDPLSNKRPVPYWDSIRPIPLLDEEQADYLLKDSLEQLRNDPHYLDSVDRRQNRFTPVGLILGGQSFNRRSSKSSFSYDPLLKTVSFNTVEGWTLQFSGSYHKHWEGRKGIEITPVIRYGLHNHHLNPFLITQYTFGKKYYNAVHLSLGQRVYQFNNANPIPQLMNSISTLLRGYNYMKIYQARFLQLEYVKGVGEGFTLRAGINYQNRVPLENTDTTTYWGKSKNEGNFTPNYPTEISNENISPHQALVLQVSLSYRPGTHYIEFPDRKVNIGSKYPLFTLNYAKGIEGLFGSDVNFDRWRFSVRDEINLNLAGELRYNVGIGGFLNAKKVELPDYQHFNGNQVRVATPYLNSFQLAPYYFKSNKEPFFSMLHLEYHLNGFLTNKIPLIKRLNLHLVTGTNAFFVGKNNNYYEFFGGVDNILKLFRVDYVFGYTEQGYYDNSIRIGIRAFSDLFQDY